jgi:hypothetical protein
MLAGVSQSALAANAVNFSLKTLMMSLRHPTHKGDLKGTL